MDIQSKKGTSGRNQRLLSPFINLYSFILTMAIFCYFCLKFVLQLPFSTYLLKIISKILIVVVFIMFDSQCFLNSLQTCLSPPLVLNITYLAPIDNQLTSPNRKRKNSSYGLHKLFLYIRQRYCPNSGYHYYKKAALVSLPLHKFALRPYFYKCLWEFTNYEHSRVLTSGFRSIALAKKSQNFGTNKASVKAYN